MKTAAASVISASGLGPPTSFVVWNRIKKTRAFLRKLSLNAEKNWVQNRGAKRRVISRDVDMVSDPSWARNHHNAVRPGAIHEFQVAAKKSRARVHPPPQPIERANGPG